MSTFSQFSGGGLEVGQSCNFIQGAWGASGGSVITVKGKVYTLVDKSNGTVQKFAAATYPELNALLGDGFDQPVIGSSPSFSGTTWLASNGTNCVAFHGSATDSVKYSTDDGLTWSNGTSAGYGAAIDYGGAAGTLFWYSSGTGMATSTNNGVTFTARTLSSSTGVSIRNVLWNGSVYVAISNGGSTNNVYTSTDGVTWTGRGLVSANLDRAVYDATNNLFFAMTSTGTCFTSPDGITWTTKTTISPAPTGTAKPIYYLGGKVWWFSSVSVQQFGNVSLTACWSTADGGTTWTQAGWLSSFVSGQLTLVNKNVYDSANDCVYAAYNYVGYRLRVDDHGNLVSQKMHGNPYNTPSGWCFNNTTGALTTTAGVSCCVSLIATGYSTIHPFVYTAGGTAQVPAGGDDYNLWVRVK